MLAFVFSSLLALVPLLIALVAIPTTFVAIFGLQQFTSVSDVVLFLVALIGLGVAIDYALLIVTRWREQRTHGASNRQAVEEAMQHGGRAVIFSGTTVGIGLLALVLLPLPFLRSIGFAGMLIPLISVAVAITLLPVLLDTVGPRLDRKGATRSSERSYRHWHALATFVVRHRVPVALASATTLIALAIPALSINVGQPDPRSIAATGPAREALDTLIAAGIGEGAFSPYTVIAPTTSAPAVLESLQDVPGIRGAVAPSDANWNRNGTSIITVIPMGQGDSSSGRTTLRSVRDAVHPIGPEVQVGGQAAQNADFVSAIYGSLGWMLALIALATYLLLARAFRSLLLPLKALVMNVLSIGAAFGIATLIFQNGHGSEAIFDIHATGSILAFIPLLAFAFLFGLSMDYEVFLLSRIREQYDETGDTDEAVIEGLSRTGRLVTAAALILFLAFAALAAAPDTPVRIFATTLGIGILLDATIVRALLVPATVSLMGRWNWWLPSSAARILRVEPSSANPRA